MRLLHLGFLLPSDVLIPTGPAETTLIPFDPCAARCDTWRLIKLTPKGVVFSFLLIPKAQQGSKGGGASQEAMPLHGMGNVDLAGV